MKRILGLTFSPYGQLTLAFCTDPFINEGDKVVAETEQGLAFGTVLSVRGDTQLEGSLPEELKNVVRKATAEDELAHEENKIFALDAQRFCEGRVQERALDMQLVAVEPLFDRSKLIFYFTAPTRIDFRELVKDLVREYHTRIELRQIGVRHETQMIGAIGSCGMVCCCRRFLRKFAPVTIKMAKEQNLFLNPAKISGICGRLLCCLSYEQDNYDQFHRACPRIGKRYITDKGALRVLRTHMARNSITLLNEQGEEIDILLDEWETLNPRRQENPHPKNHSQQPQTKNQYHDDFVIVEASPGYVDEFGELIVAQLED